MKIKLARHNFHVPPLREVRKQLRLGIETIARSEADYEGVVQDKTAIYEILCLQRALTILSKRAANRRQRLK